MFATSAIFMNKNLQEIWQKHITDRYLEPLFPYKFPLYQKENSNVRITSLLSISMAIGTLFFSSSNKQLCGIKNLTSVAKCRSLFGYALEENYFPTGHLIVLFSRMTCCLWNFCMSGLAHAANEATFLCLSPVGASYLCKKNFWKKVLQPLPLL